MAQQRAGAAVTTAGAAESRAETLAKTEPIRAGAAKTSAEAAKSRAETFKKELELRPEQEAQEEAKRLSAQREARELTGLRGDVKFLTLEKEAHESNLRFFQVLGKGGIPESIPVSWTPDKELKLNYLLALGDAGYNVDLSLFPPEGEEQTVIFLQSVIDQGVNSGLTPEQAEEAAFAKLVELRSPK